MREISRALFSIFFLSIPSLSHSASTSSGLVLLKSPSAVAKSMGEAFSSISAEEGGIGALHYNPASTAYLKGSELLLMGRNGISDDTFSGVVFGRPSRLGTFTGGFSYYSVGNIDLVDSAGRARSVRAEEDYIANLNYGKSVGGVLGFGVNVKYLSSKLVESVSASAYACDVGGQIKLNRMSMGFSVQNIGSGLKYSGTQEPLPMTMRWGISHRFDFKKAEFPSKLLWSFDLVKERDLGLKKFMGVEYLFNNMVAIRSGNQFDQDAGDFKIGFGFIMGQIRLDYDHLNIGSLNGVHTLSLTYRFSAKSSEK